MFFVSLKSRIFSIRNKRFFIGGLIACALTILCGLLAWASLRLPSQSFCEGVGKYSLKASDKGQREAFFALFGYDAREVGNTQIVVPSRGEVLEEYNEIQKSQGMNIMPYGDKSALMYEYEIREGEAVLKGYLIVYRERVIAAHLAQQGYPLCIKGLKK